MQPVLASFPTPPASPPFDQCARQQQHQHHQQQPRPAAFASPLPRPHVPVAPEDRIGTFLGNGSLQLTGIIGTGAYGVVYAAVDVQTNTPYAVKALSKLNADGSPLEARQVDYQTREIRLHYQASAHPNVVSMYKIYDGYPDCLFVVLEYCPEGDLFYNITECGRFVGKDELARRLFLQIVDAVQFLHQAGIYHRDLKPENILVTDHGHTVKLADFGLATSSDRSEDYGCGSTFYMSPECLGSNSSRPFYYCAPNDVWSLGVILVNLTCGRNPWKQASEEDSTYRAYTRSPGFLKTILPLTDELDDILARIFTADPDQRITLPELKDRIRACPRFTVPPAPAQPQQQQQQQQQLAQLPPVVLPQLPPLTPPASPHPHDEEAYHHPVFDEDEDEEFEEFDDDEDEDEEDDEEQYEDALQAEDVILPLVHHVPIPALPLSPPPSEDEDEEDYYSTMGDNESEASFVTAQQQHQQQQQPPLQILMPETPPPLLPGLQAPPIAGEDACMVGGVDAQELAFQHQQQRAALEQVAAAAAGVAAAAAAFQYRQELEVDSHTQQQQQQQPHLPPPQRPQHHNHRYNHHYTHAPYPPPPPPPPPAPQQQQQQLQYLPQQMPLPPPPPSSSAARFLPAGVLGWMGMVGRCQQQQQQQQQQHAHHAHTHHQQMLQQQQQHHHHHQQQQHYYHHYMPMFHQVFLPGTH